MKPVLWLPYRTPLTYLPNGMDCEFSEIIDNKTSPVDVFFPETSCFMLVSWDDIELRDNAEEKAREAFLRGCEARTERGAAELSEGLTLDIIEKMKEEAEAIEGTSLDEENLAKLWAMSEGGGYVVEMFKKQQEPDPLQVPIDQAIYEAKEREADRDLVRGVVGSLADLFKDAEEIGEEEESDKIPYKDGMEIIDALIKEQQESWTIPTDGTHVVKDIWPTESLTDETVKERGKIYGDPELSHENIGLQWTGIIQQHFGIRLPHALPAWLVELMMGAFKINRSARVYHEDNYVDFEAYVLKFASEHQKAPTPGFVREGGAE